MAEVKWIKLVTEFFDDEKIRIIESMPESDMVLIIWIKLLTLAGKKNMNGYIFLTENIPYTDEMLSTLFNRPVNTIRLALETFKGFGMINYNIKGEIQITNWDKHQNVEGMDKIREQNRLSQQRRREKLKEINSPTTPLKEEELDKIRLDKIRLEASRDGHVTQKPSSNPKITFNYNTQQWENITEKDISDWEIINPNCDIKIELETMRQWLMDDRTREKKHYRKFIVGWIKRAISKKPKMTMEESLRKMEVINE
jgi:predicted phage replisome organizer